MSPSAGICNAIISYPPVRVIRKVFNYFASGNNVAPDAVIIIVFGLLPRIIDNESFSDFKLIQNSVLMKSVHN